MHTHNLNDAHLAQAVAAAVSGKQDRVEIPVTFYASLIGGILAADASLNIKIDVTMGERAAGMMRGESALDIAVRETRATAAKAVVAIGEKIQEAADAQTELHALCVEADARMTAAEEEAEDRQFWRLRASIRAIRDGLTEHSRAGVRIPDMTITDLNSLDAWAPMSAKADLRTLRPALTGPSPEAKPATLHAVLVTAEALTAKAETAPVVWRDLTPSDIAAMTSDHLIRHLLTKAAELRDEAISVTGSDPERAGKILAEVSAIEREAMEAAMGQIKEKTLSRLEAVTSVLRDRTDTATRK